MAGLFARYTDPPSAIFSRPATPSRRDATEAMRTALISGACVRYWRDCVRAFNDAVDLLNAEYVAGATEPADLDERFAALVHERDARAESLAAMLETGADDEDAVLTLFSAGALPIAGVRAFPGVDFRRADWRKALEHLEVTPEGVLLRTASPAEVARRLASHPELLQAADWLREQRGIELTPMERCIVDGQAHRDELIAIDGGP